ncbi:ATP-binding protein [Pseudonocardia sp.]|uniref:ATP-binding protein n=1 Tax=Pseudonocardia sp. TaxID=60912 RepID=UPI0031FC4BB8
MARLLAYLPRGNLLDDKAWQRRHRLLQWVLLLHVPGLALFGLWLGNRPAVVGYVLIAPVVALVGGYAIKQRRLASFFVTGGLVFCSAGLVVLTKGTIEAHFHFFIIIGFIALYQDWVPFLWNVTFTVVSHGIGTIWLGNLIFATPAGQANPWLWSGIHGVAVLAACVGMVIFWRITEDEQVEKEALGRQLVTADAEIGRRRFTSEMLVNLARRNQSMLYRQLDIINQLEEKEQDPDALSDLFTLDHLATRVRRNAENLLVLAGEQPPRTWSAPVPLRDVVRAAIAETEDLDRVVFAVNEAIAVAGHAVADLTHLLAELTENAVRFSPPDTVVTVRVRPDRRDEGAYTMTIEDWGVGMPPDDLAAANELLARPRDVDLAVAQRLGFHVVSRLAARHAVGVSLSTTPGSGVTAIVSLPAELFAETGDRPAPAPAAEDVVAVPRPYVPGHRFRRPDGFATGPVRPVAADRCVGAESAAGVGRLSTESALPRPRHAADGAPAIASSPQSLSTQGSPPQYSPQAPSTPQGAPRAAEQGWVDGGWRGWWNPESAGAAEAGPANGQNATVDSRTAVAEATPSNGATHGAQPAARLRPVPAPRQYSDSAPSGSGRRTPPGAAPSGGGPSLRRRVPQSHLAPELRRPDAADDPAPVPQYDGAAASALSRYQASRKAAQAQVGEYPENRGGEST